MYTYPEALNAMEAVAKDLFSKAYPNVRWNVRVAADSVTGTASVDWNGDPRTERYVSVTINMPVRKATYRMTADEFTLWSAYLLHEVGHPCETDKSLWKAAVAAGRHRLLNALEDVREEKCTIDRGIAHNAKQLFSRLIDGLHAKGLAEGYDPNDVHNIGWTLSALGRHANGYAIDISDIHARLDPNGIVGKIVPGALLDLAVCQSTQDCSDLSERIIEAVNVLRKAEKEEEGVENSPPAPQGTSQGGRSEPDDENPPESETTPDEAPRGGSDVPEPEDEAKPEPKTEAEFTDEDIAEVDLTPNDRDNMVSNNKDLQTQRRLTMVLRELAKQAYREKAIAGRIMRGSVDSVAGTAAKMGLQRALLARAIKSPDLDDYEGGRRYGRLDRRVLSRVVTGNAHVFGKRISVEGYDSDVQILVDGSGSMSGYRILAASTLALIVAQAASQVGVDCHAHVFNDLGLHTATKGRQKPVGRKFAYMVNQIMGGTPLTENLLIVAKEQARRAPNKRRILFVISDGDCDMGVETAKAAGDYIEQSLGAEIANLHIGKTVTGTFRNEVAVDVNNVSKTGLRQLTNLLERGL